MIVLFTVDVEVGNEGGNIAQELRALLTRWLISLSGDCRPFRFVPPPPLIFVVIVVAGVYVDTPLE